MRYVLTVLALLAIIGGLAGVKYKQISMLMGAGKRAAKMGAPPEAVGTSPIKQDTWGDALSAVGSIAAARGVTLSNDAPGIVSGIHFESGQVVTQGQVLLDLDSQVERAQLASAAARRELASVNADRTRALVATQSLARSQQDSDDAVLKTSHADLDALQAQIARKVVRAPFSGRLGIRQVNLGQYLNPGAPIAVLEAIDTVYVDFTLPQQRLSDLALGMPVRIEIEGSPIPPQVGKVDAIDPTIDAATRSIKLRATVDNKAGKLLPGMFANVAVLLPTQHPVVIVPLLAVVHASYGDSLFVVDEKASDDGPPKRVARQQFVRIGETRGDYVSVLDGVKAGDEIVTSGAFKLRNGAAITIDNAIQPRAELSPHPENR